MNLIKKQMEFLEKSTKKTFRTHDKGESIEGECQECGIPLDGDSKEKLCEACQAEDAPEELLREKEKMVEADIEQIQLENYQEKNE